MENSAIKAESMRESRRFYDDEDSWESIFQRKMKKQKRGSARKVSKMDCLSHVKKMNRFTSEKKKMNRWGDISLSLVACWLVSGLPASPLHWTRLESRFRIHGCKRGSLPCPCPWKSSQKTTFYSSPSYYLSFQWNQQIGNNS